jgi:tetratricopeptide (TPR) repeat protein
MACLSKSSNNMAVSLPTALLFAIFFLPGLPAVADVGHGTMALNQGRIDDAIVELRADLKENPHDAAAHQTLCRVFYSEELADRAIAECEAAVSDSRSDAALTSENLMWLGRAYGMKAARANPIIAFRIAKKVVAAFERAVQADPKNVSALSDLGEYYVGAPSIVGGGLDKADRLVARMMPISASKAHRLLAMIAEKRNDYETAEAEFKRAFEAQRTPQTLIDVADFYQRRKQCDESVSTVKTLVRMDRAKDSAIVDASSVLTACNREPQLARELLASYLTSSSRSDSAPAARVHVQLGDLMGKSGDTEGARREYEAALALASEYAPARKALQAR